MPKPLSKPPNKPFSGPLAEPPTDRARALHFQTALLSTGWAKDVLITMQAGRISAIETGCAPPAGAERHAIALPGAANLHSHAFQRAMAGRGERRQSGRDDFWSWRDAVYKLASRLTPETMRAVAALAQIEMLEAGFTRVGEFHYLHHQENGAPYANIAAMGEAIVSAAADSGIGLTLMPVFYAHSDFGGAAPEPGQARFVTALDSYADLVAASRKALSALPDAEIGIAPHSLRAVTPEELAELIALAGDAPIHIHIAEQQREVTACIEALGARPVEWLLANAPVGENWCLVHATHMSDHEAQALARSGAVAGLCPITEANLGDGIFPAADYAAAGGRYGVGSDSNVEISLSGELRLLEYGQRLALQKRCVLANETYPSTGRALYEAALDGGAQALGVTSGLVVGASADLVSLNLNNIAFAGSSRAETQDALLDSFIFAPCAPALSGMIDRVWRAGRLVVDGGQHIARPQIEQDFCAALGQLW